MISMVCSRSPSPNSRCRSAINTGRSSGMIDNSLSNAHRQSVSDASQSTTIHLIDRIPERGSKTTRHRIPIGVLNQPPDLLESLSQIRWLMKILISDEYFHQQYTSQLIGS